MNKFSFGQSNVNVPFIHEHSFINEVHSCSSNDFGLCGRFHLTQTGSLQWEEFLNVTSYAKPAFWCFVITVDYCARTSLVHM